MKLQLIIKLWTISAALTLLNGQEFELPEDEFFDFDKPITDFKPPTSTQINHISPTQIIEKVIIAPNTLKPTTSSSPQITPAIVIATITLPNTEPIETNKPNNGIKPNEPTLEPNKAPESSSDTSQLSLILKVLLGSILVLIVLSITLFYVFCIRPLNRINPNHEKNLLDQNYSYKSFKVKKGTIQPINYKGKNPIACLNLPPPPTSLPPILLTKSDRP